MYVGKLVFSQVMEHLPLHVFHQSVARYNGSFKVKTFTCLDQYLCMAFAQLTHRESLRDIEVCLRAQKSKLYHMGIRGPIARNTLANANKIRDWRIYEDLAHSLIKTARHLYRDDGFGLELKNTVYALDATNIELCLSVFPGDSTNGPRELSGCTHCWICVAIFLPSSISPTANKTKSVSWTISPRKQALFTYWIAGI